ncbi:MAG: DNA alkylation repair protein [Muribaculaceae bacterium]|nr:DNA alkylation repair protein [Muribaculaceae bacterium]
MGNVSNEIETRMVSMGDNAQAAHLARFFKTGKGEYGEGDRFLGIRVPQTRELVKEYRRVAEIEDVSRLLLSPWHEIRLAGFLLLVELYKRAKSDKDKRHVVDFYLSVLHRGNNWDLVDVVAPKILGLWLVRHPEERGVLYELAAMDGCLWHQRTAVVACWSIIREGDYEDTLRLSEMLMTHSHDLIHKATGWMLREAGKRRGKAELLTFLDRYADKMPRTMLRYAIERLTDEERRHYMSLGKPLS